MYIIAMDELLSYKHSYYIHGCGCICLVFIQVCAMSQRKLAVSHSRVVNAEKQNDLGETKDKERKASHDEMNIAYMYIEIHNAMYI